MRDRTIAVSAAAMIGAGALVLAGWLLWRPGPAADAGAQTAAPNVSASMLEEMREAFADRQGPPMSGPWRLSLPEDHAAHPDAAAETWAVFAHLRDPDGAAISAIVTLSRFGTAPGPTDTGNAWTPRAAWLGQAAIARPDPLAEERLSRGIGAAGFDAGSGAVWLDDWHLQPPTGDDGGFELQARVEGHLLDLGLTPVKTALAPAETTEGPTRGFAMSRLEVKGRMGPAQTEVHGLAWIDRLWGDLPPPGGPLVYDRAIVHLDDGTDLSLLRTRRRDGRGGATLDGVLVDASGTATAISEAAAWAEGGTPGTWSLGAAGLALRATELPGGGLRDFAAPFRHAGLGVEGTRDGQPVRGTGSLVLSAEAAR